MIAYLIPGQKKMIIKIKSMTDAELLSNYKLYSTLQSAGFNDILMREMLAIELDIRKKSS